MAFEAYYTSKGEVQNLPRTLRASNGDGTRYAGIDWEFVIPPTVPTRTGYVFNGWKMYEDVCKDPATGQTDRNKLYHAGDSIVVDTSYNTATCIMNADWSKADSTPPVIAGADDKTITVGDSFDPKTGVTATDKEDGDLTGKIQIAGTVDNTKPGKYELTYTVSDAAGNKTTKKRTITVIDRTLTATAMPQTGSAQTMTLTAAGTALLLAGASVALKRRQSSTR